MLEKFLDFLKNKYANFKGRARRKEFWMFFLFVSAINVILGTLVQAFPQSSLAAVLGPLGGLFVLTLFIPYFATMVRRLHDVGKSGVWIFINIVPLVGIIWLTVLLATDSQAGDNQYGAYPK